MQIQAEKNHMTRLDLQQKIRHSFARQRQALSLRPQLGVGTAQTTARVLEGLRCEISEGDFHMCVDMSPKAGGTGQGPNPGILGRGAFASCLAITYMQWAAFRGLQITSLEVNVTVAYDVGADYGVRPAVRPGYQHIQYTVHICSDELPERIHAVIEEADKHAAYLSVWKNNNTIDRVTIIQNSQDQL